MKEDINKDLNIFLLLLSEATYSVVNNNFKTVVGPKPKKICKHCGSARQFIQVTLLLLSVLLYRPSFQALYKNTV